MTLSEKLARYAELLHGSLVGLSLPPGATIAQNGRVLYQPRRLSHLAEHQPPDEEETARTPSPRLGMTRPLPGPCLLEEDELLSQLVRPPPKHLCILGDGGLGKSELFQQLAWSLSERLGSHTSGTALRVPVLAFLKDWKPRPNENTLPKEWLSRFIRNAINHVAEPGEEFLSEQELMELCRANALVVLLDGLDEVIPVSERSELLEAIRLAMAPDAFLSSCSVLLSSRPEALHDLDLGARFRVARHRLEPLENMDAVARYVKLYHGERSPRALRLESWVRRASPQLQQFLRVPLHLSLLCATHEAGAFPLPGTPAELLEAGMRLLYSRRLKQHIEAGLELLGELAEVLVEAGSIDKREAVKRAIRVCKTNELIGAAFTAKDMEPFLDRLAEQSGILRPARDGYCFARQVYADYLAGRRLAHRAQEQPMRFLRTVQKTAWRPEWEEPLRWAAAELWRSNRAIAQYLVEWVLVHVEKDRDDLVGTLATLACRLFGGTSDLSEPAERPVVERAADNALRAWCAAHNYAGAQAVADRSVVLAMLPSSARNCLIASSLRLLWSSGTDDRFQLTGGKRLFSLAGLAVKLGARPEQVVQSGCVSVRHFLMLAMACGEETLTELASATDEVWLCDLVALLRDPFACFCWDAVARAVRNKGIASRDAAFALMSMLGNATFPFIRPCAIDALGDLMAPYPEVISELSRAVDMPHDFFGDVGAADALARLAKASHEALKALVAIATKSESFGGRVAAAHAMLSHGLVADGLQSALMDVLTRGQPSVLRIEAARALCELGVQSVEVGSALVQIASDENEPARERAIQSLGLLRAPTREVVRFLRGLLANEPHGPIAAGALRNLGEVTHEVVAEAVARLDNATLADDPIPGEWVKVLAQLDTITPEVVAVLLRVIKDRQAGLAREYATEAIRNLIEGVFASCGEVGAATEGRVRKLGTSADDVAGVLLDVLRDPDACECWHSASFLLEKLGRSSDAGWALVDALRDRKARGIGRGLAPPGFGPMSDESVAAVARLIRDPELARTWIPYVIRDGLSETRTRAAAEALMELGDERAALRCCGPLGLVVLQDRTIKSRAELRLDLDLCPPELAAFLEKSTRDQADTTTPRGAGSGQPALSDTDEAIFSWIKSTLRPTSEGDRRTLLDEARAMLVKTAAEKLRDSQRKAYRSWWWARHCSASRDQIDNYGDAYAVLRETGDTPFYDVNEFPDNPDTWKKHLSDAKRKLDEGKKRRPPGGELRSAVPPVHFGPRNDQDDHS